MTRKRWRLAIIVGAVVLVGLAAGLAVLLTRDGTKPPPNHVAYARLWSKTVLGSPMDAVLEEWPKPYQVYPDGAKNKCYEWWDKPLLLYNLCFKKGVLVTKSIA